DHPHRSHRRLLLIFNKTSASNIPLKESALLRFLPKMGARVPTRVGAGVVWSWVGTLASPWWSSYTVSDFWRNLCIETSCVSLHIHPNQKLLPTLQFLQERFIILPNYNGVRVIEAKCFFKNGKCSLVE